MVTYAYKAGRFAKLGKDRKAYDFKINVPEPNSALEKKLHEYLIQTIASKQCYHLIPFVFENKVMIEVAKHYYLHRSGTIFSLYNSIGQIFAFCQWLGKSPDELIEECKNQIATNLPQTIENLNNTIDQYIFFRKEKKLSNTTLRNSVCSINIFFHINRIDLNLRLKIQKANVNTSRAITVNELAKIMAAANLRGKVIIGILAVSGIRIGTLVKLQYRHVKRDLEKGISPVHLAIEPQQNKGSYHGYSTFINWEVAQYLKQYLDERRKGTRSVKPETISDESPLIRLRKKNKVKPISIRALSSLIKNLYFQTGILTKKPNLNPYSYEVGSNSLRKFFRTQMAVLGVESHFIEYMMGHKRERYLDVKMVGVEYLRRVYDLSGISIKPQTETNRLLLLRKAITKLGYCPEEILKPEFLQGPL